MKLRYALITAVFLTACMSQPDKREQVTFKDDPDAQKVDVSVGGKYFTSFIYPDNLEKQTLYPIVTPSGKTITRGYPLNPRPFERTDHPHHVGLWFNFGDVNGLDFWNNSFNIKPEDKPKYGSIKFNKIVSESPESGELVTSANWVDNDGNVLLTEETTYHFSGEENLRIIERIIKTDGRTESYLQRKQGRAHWHAP